MKESQAQTWVSRCIGKLYPLVPAWIDYAKRTDGIRVGYDRGAIIVGHRDLVPMRILAQRSTIIWLL